MVVTFVLALAMATTIGAGLTAVDAQQPETLSLLGEPLYAPPVPKADRARLEDEAAQARAALARNPADADAALRLSRAQRDLGHVGDALETLTRAIEGNADAPALHLERGRGFVAIRKFELAQREFRRAAETIPAAHCDLAFALYLLADYTGARQEYGTCQTPGVFAYLAARRAGENAGPKPSLEQDPRSASRVIKLPGSVASKRAPPEASPAGAYMEAVERLLANQKPAAKDLLKPIVEQHKNEWMEPVYVAAENDYARIVKAEPKKKTRRRED